MTTDFLEKEKEANDVWCELVSQKAKQFRHDVSSIDLLMHEGPKAKEHLKSNESLQAFTEKGLV